MRQCAAAGQPAALSPQVRCLSRAQGLAHEKALSSWPLNPDPRAGEDLIGARAYRVVFAGVSLPLAVAAVVYFINHRYSGTPLWDLRGTPGVHAAVWGLSLVSFFFLYPSTFNLLEVRAVGLGARALGCQGASTSAQAAAPELLASGQGPAAYPGLDTLAEPVNLGLQGLTQGPAACPGAVV